MGDTTPVYTITHLKILPNWTLESDPSPRRTAQAGSMEREMASFLLQELQDFDAYSGHFTFCDKLAFSLQWYGRMATWRDGTDLRQEKNI